MEVAPGPTVGLTDHIALPAPFRADDGKDLRPNGFCFVGEDAEDSSDSSSIGAPSSSAGSDSDDRGHDDEVQSQLNNNNDDDPLGSLDSLEDSLPVKRGLSNFFTGKSKSFASLSEAASSGDLVKPENPFNKRQRILMACKSSWARRASYSTLLPTLADDEEDDDEDQISAQPLPLRRLRRDEKKFRSPRSFSLSDLQRV